MREINIAGNEDASRRLRGVRGDEIALLACKAPHSWPLPRCNPPPGFHEQCLVAFFKMSQIELGQWRSVSAAATASSWGVAEMKLASARVPCRTAAYGRSRVNGFNQMSVAWTSKASRHAGRGPSQKRWPKCIGWRERARHQPLKCSVIRSGMPSRLFWWMRPISFQEPLAFAMTISRQLLRRGNFARRLKPAARRLPASCGWSG